MRKKFKNARDAHQELLASVQALLATSEEQLHANRMLKMIVKSQQLRIQILQTEKQIISIKHWMDIHGAKTHQNAPGAAQKSAGISP